MFGLRKQQQAPKEVEVRVSEAPPTAPGMYQVRGTGWDDLKNAVHARIIDDSAYVATTGRQLSSDRLTFQPDWMANISTDYRITGMDRGACHWHPSTADQLMMADRLEAAIRSPP